MFEKGVWDWSITKNKNEKFGYNIFIGTWSNFDQGIIDCLAFLTLNKKDETNTFLNYLRERNEKEKWFDVDKKVKYLNYIKKYGINPHAFLNFYNLPEVEENEQINDDIIKKFIDSDKNIEILSKIILEAKDIENLYLCIQEFKANLVEEIYENFYDYVEEVKNEC